MLAAAVLGNQEQANEFGERYQEIMFPYTANHRDTYLKASQKILESLRGVGIKVTRAGWDVSRLRGMNDKIFGKGNG